MNTTTETPVENGVVLDDHAYDATSGHIVGRLAAKYDALESMVAEFNQKARVLEAASTAPEITVSECFVNAIQDLIAGGITLNRMLLEQKVELAGLEMSWSLAVTPEWGRA